MNEERDPRILLTVFLLIAVCLLSVPVYAQYGGGKGGSSSPYLIYTAEQMNAIGLREEDWNKYFKLMADIDLDSYTGTEFNIIGYIKGEGMGRGSQVVESKPFTGVFDGNGHTISNFSYTCTNTNRIGVFGYVEGANAEIRDLGLTAPNIDAAEGRSVGSLVGLLRDGGTISNCHVQGVTVSGNADIGGLVGNSMNGIITNCTSSGSVSGRENIGGLVGWDWGGTITNCTSSGSASGIGAYVGGLVGHNHYDTITTCHSSANVSGRWAVGGLVGDNEGTISDCSSTGNVTGTEAVGGLVGYNWGDLGSTITNCYSAGSVLGTTDAGGLVGSNYGNNEGSVSGSFWDIETSGQTSSAGGTGKTTSEMQVESTFTDAGWDFVGESVNGTEDIWTIYEGTDYPRLAWIGEPTTNPPYGGGTGTQANPYLIYTAEQLNMIGFLQSDWGRHFRLMADIDLGGFTGTDFNIIGYARSWDDKKAFTGVFDGNGKKIYNFSYTSTDRDYVGLFAYVDGENALIKDLGLIDPNIDAGTSWGFWRVASLVAVNSGTISNCFVQGGTVSGNEDVGGLVGNNLNGTITNCYSTASVSGLYMVGGLVGSNSGTITDSFWDIETSGQTSSAGGTGKTTAEMQTTNTFLDADWDFINVWDIGENQTYPFLRTHSAGDVNKDSVVNFLDLCIMAGQWMEMR